VNLSLGLIEKLTNLKVYIMTTTIKVQYQDIIAFLELNKGKKVSTILAEVTEMCVAKKGGSGGKTFIRNDEGIVTHVFCYYHKKWEEVSTVEYGDKKSTATGLNTMCKEGVSKWTKQQAMAKKAEAGLLDKLLSGELSQDTLAAARQEIEDTRQVVVPREDDQGTDEV
jgi:hypothetical protein